MILIAAAGAPMSRKLLAEWIALAAATCLALAFLSEGLARGAVAILLALIAAIYVGFALAAEEPKVILRQAIGCAGFVALALFGLWFNWWFLVLGLVLHGFWDALHHGERGGNVAPLWYPPVCAVYDWLVAIFVALRFAV
jgi:hypothetical protein